MEARTKDITFVKLEFLKCHKQIEKFNFLFHVTKLFDIEKKNSIFAKYFGNLKKTLFLIRINSSNLTAVVSFTIYKILMYLLPLQPKEDTQYRSFKRYN